MAYQNVNFPTVNLIHGFKTAVQMPTEIVGNFSSEYRINRYSQSKYIFTYPSFNISYTNYSAIYNFLASVGWQRDSFNFVNPQDGLTYKVRLNKMLTSEIVGLDSNNNPLLIKVGDIELIQVFNE